MKGYVLSPDGDVELTDNVQEAVSKGWYSADFHDPETGEVSTMTTIQDIKEAMRRGHIPAPIFHEERKKREAGRETSTLGAIGATATGAAEGLTLGFLPDILAAAEQLGIAPEKAAEFYNQFRKEQAEDYPVAYVGGNILAGAGAGIGSAAKYGLSKAGQLGAAAVGGALEGFGGSYGEDTSDRAKSAVVGASIPVAIGGAGKAIGKTVDTAKKVGMMTLSGATGLTEDEIKFVYNNSEVVKKALTTSKSLADVAKVIQEEAQSLRNKIKSQASEGWDILNKNTLKTPIKEITDEIDTVARKTLSRSGKTKTDAKVANKIKGFRSEVEEGYGNKKSIKEWENTTAKQKEAYEAEVNKAPMYTEGGPAYAEVRPPVYASRPSEELSAADLKLMQESVSNKFGSKQANSKEFNSALDKAKTELRGRLKKKLIAADRRMKVDGKGRGEYEAFLEDKQKPLQDKLKESEALFEAGLKRKSNIPEAGQQKIFDKLFTVMKNPNAADSPDMKQLEKLFPGEAEKLKLSQLADKTKGYRLDPSTQALRMGAESQLALSARLGARPLGVGIINSAAAINDFIKSSIDDAPRYAPVLAPIGRFLSATGESKYGKMFSEALKRSKNPNNPQTIMVIHNALRNKNPEYRDAYDNYISLEGDIDGNNQRE